MKKQVMNFGKSIFVSALLLLMGQTVFAQKSNINFSTIMRGKVSINYELALTPNTSAVGGFKIYNKSFTNNNFTNDGFRFTGAYRMYLTKKSKALNGIYVAPNFSFGKHQISYERTTKTGLGVGFLFAAVDIIGDGDLDFIPQFQTPETITGNATVNAMSLGIKIGVQRTWKMLSLDAGINLSKNSTSGLSDGLKLSNGELKELNSDMSGMHPELYFGVGFNF